MSNKRKRKASNKFRINHPREVGKFYKIADSKGGHPARIYYADVEKDIYFVQRFSKEKRKGREKLLHNIDPNSDDEQWLIKKPVITSYDGIKYEPRYENYRIHPEDEIITKKYQRFDLIKK